MLLEQIDLQQFGTYVCDLQFDREHVLRRHAGGLRRRVLFKKAWSDFPDDPSLLMNYIRLDQMVKMPDMYGYMLEVADSHAVHFGPTKPVEHPGPVPFLQLRRQNDHNHLRVVLPEYKSREARGHPLARVEVARKDTPGWKAGGVIKALIECRLGRLEPAREELGQLFARSKDDWASSNVYWIVGSELENYATTRDLAVTAYEIGAKLAAESQNSRIDFDYGPAKRLVSMYVRDNRVEDARKILISVPKNENSMGYPDGYFEQMRMQSLGSAAGELLKLGFFAADAVTLYNQVDCPGPGNPCRQSQLHRQSGSPVTTAKGGIDASSRWTPA